MHGAQVTNSPTSITVNLSAITHNLRLVRKIIGQGVGVIAVVKSDAYSLGAVPIADALESQSVDYLGVARIEEACELRKAGIETPILVLGTLTEQEIPIALECDVTLTLVSLPFAERLYQMAMAAQKVVKVHCDIDTGMGRIGFDPDTAAGQLGELVKFSNIDIEGVYTHLVEAEIEKDAFTHSQIKKFRRTLNQIDDMGIPYEMTHVANSAGILNYETARFDAVRPGLLLYGVTPHIAMEPPAGLRQVLRFESKIAFLKRVPADTPVGYGRTYVTPAPTAIATIPVGYADGIPLALSNKGEVLVRGKRCPIIGSVTMEHTMIDVGGVPEVAVDDTVTIVGDDGDMSIRIEDIANKAGMVPHAVMTGLSPRVKHVYTGDASSTEG